MIVGKLEMTIPDIGDHEAIINCCINGEPGTEQAGRELYNSIPVFMRELVNNWILFSYAVGKVHGMREIIK